ncbi:MAG: hypothetical protein JNK04_23835 [Myxococcales bacterium]|nr:hypothetical protein [Myxococcales bacterium]
MKEVRMKKVMACVAASAFALLAINCVGVESEETEADEDAVEETGEAEQAIKIGDYYNPPRCGPRNCEAMCVTCYYDICRIQGGSVSECNAEKELCKDECYPGTCVPGDPGCPCTNPTDPLCF